MNFLKIWEMNTKHIAHVGDLHFCHTFSEDFLNICEMISKFISHFGVIHCPNDSFLYRFTGFIEK